MKHEWALIAFTLISQLAAGSTLAYAVLNSFRKNRISSIPSGFDIRNPELLLIAFLLSAILVSFLHLGNFLNAYHALNNLPGSWISREILGLTLFMLSLSFLFVTRWRLPARSGIHSVLLIFAAVSGLSLVYIMIRLYMIPAVVTWNTWYTPSSFILTSLILGTYAVLVYQYLCGTDLLGSKLIIRLLYLLFLLEALITIGNQFLLKDLDVLDNKLFLPGNSLLIYTLIRVALIGSVLLLLIYFDRGLRTARGLSKLASKKWLPALSLLLVIMEQLIGRWLFFASYLKTGI